MCCRSILSSYFAFRLFRDNHGGRISALTRAARIIPRAPPLLSPLPLLLLAPQHRLLREIMNTCVGGYHFALHNQLFSYPSRRILTPFPSSPSGGPVRERCHPAVAFSPPQPVGDRNVSRRNADEGTELGASHLSAVRGLRTIVQRLFGLYADPQIEYVVSLALMEEIRLFRRGTVLNTSLHCT